MEESARKDSRRKQGVSWCKVLEITLLSIVTSRDALLNNVLQVPGRFRHPYVLARTEHDINRLEGLELVSLRKFLRASYRGHRLADSPQLDCHNAQMRS